MRWLAVLGLFIILAGCGENSGTSPEEGVKFPKLPSAVVAEWCIRGQIVPPEMATGMITMDDCEIIWLNEVREGWRVRVKTSGPTEIRYHSEDIFASLYLFRVDLKHPENPYLLATARRLHDADEAILTHDLNFGVEYWVFVTSHWTLVMNDPPTPYSLSITQ